MHGVDAVLTVEMLRPTHNPNTPLGGIRSPGFQITAAPLPPHPPPAPAAAVRPRYQTAVRDQLPSFHFADLLFAHEVMHIITKEAINCFDVLPEKFICRHRGANIAIVNTIECIEFDGITPEVAGKEG